MMEISKRDGVIDENLEGGHEYLGRDFLVFKSKTPKSFQLTVMIALLW